MRRVLKGDPLPEYTAYIRQHHPEKWTDIPVELRALVGIHILKNEQSGWSAYTERKLDQSDPTLHVDHFLKQQFCKTEERFDWYNLFTDEHAGEELYGADFKDNSKKTPVKSKEDYRKLINPSQTDPHDYFSYLPNGDIIPKPGISNIMNEKADFTIKAFNLCGALSGQRFEILRIIANCKQGQVSPEDTKHILLECSSFPSLIEFFCQPDIWDTIDASSLSCK